MSRACLQIQEKRGKTMTVNMPSIVSLFHSFFYFFYWERFSFSTFSRFMPFNISVFQLFALKIYGFFNFSVLLPLCSSVLGGFFILWTSDFRGLFGFGYICYCFLFSCIGPIAKMFSYYRVLIFARRWVLFWKLETARFAHLLILFFAVRHFRWSATTNYLFSYYYHF